MTNHVGERAVSVGQLRSVLDEIPEETPLLVGIRDRHHFNTLLGELRVVGVVVMQRGENRALVFDVEPIS